MKAAAQTTFAEHLGLVLGRSWRACMRLESRAMQWLAAKGWSPFAAKALMRVGELTAVVVLGYLAFWLALALGALVLAAWGAGKPSAWHSDEPEWREGQAGFGLYTQDEHRVDPYVSDGD